MNKSNVIFIIVVLILIAGGYYFVQSIQQSAQSAVGGAVNSAIAPFEQSNAALQTQVANLMHPTPTIIPDPVTIISDVHALARLELADPRANADNGDDAGVGQRAVRGGGHVDDVVSRD